MKISRLVLMSQYCSVYLCVCICVRVCVSLSTHMHMHILACTAQLPVYLHYQIVASTRAGMFVRYHIFHQLNNFFKNVMNEFDVLKYMHVFIAF